MPPSEVVWEVTRTCNAGCRFCPTGSDGLPRGSELRTVEAYGLIAQVATWGTPPPTLVLSGGDPLERRDLLDLVAHAARRGLRVVVELAATPRLTPSALRDLRSAGCSLVRLALDGPSAPTHEAFRGCPGSFGPTLEACRAAAAAGLPFRIATAVWPGNVRHLPALERLVRAPGSQGWDLFFFVPDRRTPSWRSLRPSQAALVMRRLRSPSRGLDVAGVEAPDGRLDALTVTAAGYISPGRFLPLTLGHVYRDSLAAAWESEVVRRLRAPGLRGSRARAYAATGDPAGIDPLAVPAAAPRRTPRGRRPRRPTWR